MSTHFDELTNALWWNYAARCRLNDLERRTVVKTLGPDQQPVISDEEDWCRYLVTVSSQRAAELLAER